MDQVSRPVQILLAVTLLFAALWFVVLRPKSSAGGEAASAPATAAQTPAPSSGAAPGTAGLKRAIDKAHAGVATADGDAARAQQSSADGSAAAGASAPAAVPAARSGAGSSSDAAPKTAAKPHATHRAAPTHQPAGSPQVRAVKSALRHHKAVVIAFVDPNTADARSVAQEVRHVSHFGGRAVTLAVPIAKLSDYAFITNKVEVTVAPTVVIVDPHRSATTIVGFTDRGEIEQRLADALATKRR